MSEPKLYDYVDERIERIAENRMDMFDTKLALGKWTQEEYDNEVHLLNLWVEAAYKNAGR